MPLPDSTPVAAVFIRLGIGLLVLAWSVWSLRTLYAGIQDVRRRWGTWDTYPIPDKRATWHLTIVFLVLAGWALFTGALTFWLAWSFGV